MKINPRIWTRTALALALFALAAGAAHAQETLNGTWTATYGDKYADRKSGKNFEKWGDADAEDKTEKRDGLHLSLERRTERGGRSQMGQTYDFSELQGITREQAQGTGPVRFALVREAGRVDLEGSFQNGRGSGTYTFTPDRGFVSAMKGRGFDCEMKESGFPGLRMEELVKARIFKIDADFVREAARLGFDKEPFESLVKMRIFKVTPEFVAEVRGEGLNDLAVEDLVKMRIFKIDGEFIRRAKADGVPLDVEKLVQRRIGVRDRY